MAIHEIISGRQFLGDEWDSIYSILAYTKPEIVLDIGAAFGGTTAKIRKHCDATIHAFEPFPNNIKYFKAKHEQDKKVVLHEMAASDCYERTKFYIPKTVKGTEHGWEHMPGYSSGGTFEPRHNPEITIDVEMVPVGDVVDGHIGFAKIDVEGHEYRVLKGLEKKLANNMIDILFIEFSGAQDVLELMFSMNFVVLDTFLLLTLKNTDTSLDGFSVIKEINMSSGLKGLHAWYLNMPRGYELYCKTFADLKRIFSVVQTDLVFVSKPFFQSFIRAIALLQEASSAI